MTALAVMHQPKTEPAGDVATESAFVVDVFFPVLFATLYSTAPSTDQLFRIKIYDIPALPGSAKVWGIATVAHIK